MMEGFLFLVGGACLIVGLSVGFYFITKAINNLFPRVVEVEMRDGSKETYFDYQIPLLKRKGLIK